MGKKNMELIIKSCIKMAFMNQSFLFKRFYLFLDRREGKEKERERNINVWLPLVRPPHQVPGPQPRHVSWLGITGDSDLQAGTQSTEPHQPGNQSSLIYFKSPFNLKSYSSYRSFYSILYKQKEISKRTAKGISLRC